MIADGSGQKNLTKNLKGASFPSFSPDGSKIVFNSIDSDNLEICIMNVDGSGKVNFTNNPARDECPSFSPDGAKIAFTSDRDGEGYKIYMMNVDGTGLASLTKKSYGFYPSFLR